MIRIPLAVALLTASLSAHAAPFLEIPDAGHLIATAQSVGAGIDSINGELAGTPIVPTSGDIDVYRLNLAAGLFTATVSAGFDSALVLFDALGLGLRADDDSGAGVNAMVSETLAAGVYYLGVFQSATMPLRPRRAAISGLTSSPTRIPNPTARVPRIRGPGGIHLELCLPMAATASRSTRARSGPPPYRNLGLWRCWA